MNQTNQLHDIRLLLRHKRCTKKLFDEMGMGPAKEDRSIFMSDSSRANTLEIFLRQFLRSQLPFLGKLSYLLRCTLCHGWKNTILIQRSTEQNLQITFTSAGNHELSNIYTKTPTTSDCFIFWSTLSTYRYFVNMTLFFEEWSSFFPKEENPVHVLWNRELENREKVRWKPTNQTYV